VDHIPALLQVRTLHVAADTPLAGPVGNILLEAGRILEGVRSLAVLAVRSRVLEMEHDRDSRTVDEERRKGWRGRSSLFLEEGSLGG
jgi:hypothetical protein